MARNIVFIILFIVLYGGIFILGNYKTGGTLTDRNGFGELTESHYDCDKYSIEMDFEDKWLITDGMTVRESYTDKELNEYYGLPDEFDILVRISSFNMEAECICYKDYNYESEMFTDTYLRTFLSSLDGYAENCKYILSSAKGNGEKIATYYYEPLDEDVGYFNAYANVGENSIWVSAYYYDNDGLDELIDFVRNKLYLNSSAGTAL